MGNGPFAKINRALRVNDDLMMADPAGGQRSIPPARVVTYVAENIGEQFRLPTSDSYAPSELGEIGMDTDVTGFDGGVLKYFEDEEMGVVAMPIAQFGTANDGDVVTYVAASNSFELAAGGGGGGGGAFTAAGSTEITASTAIALTAATGNEIGLDLSYTVNKVTSGNDTLIFANKTNTASPGTSRFIEFQAATTTQFHVNDQGAVFSQGLLHAEGAATPIVDPQSQFLYDTGLNGSVDWGSRVLANNSGSTTVDWNSMTLDDGSGTRVDWGMFILYDSAAYGSVDWGGRVLADSSGGTTVDWNSHQLTATGYLSVDWSNRLLHDTGGTYASVDWGNRVLQDTLGTSRLDWGSSYLLDTSGYTSVDWENRALQNSSLETVFDFSQSQQSAISTVSTGTDLAYETAINDIINVLSTFGLTSI